MSQVYLVHESGKKYGPYFYFPGPGACTPSVTIGLSEIAIARLKEIGFGIEVDLPHRIIINRWKFDKVLDRLGITCAEGFKENFWQNLVEASEQE